MSKLNPNSKKILNFAMHTSFLLWHCICKNSHRDIFILKKIKIQIEKERSSQMFNEEKNTKIFLGGLITGGLIGGLAGLIFAPKSGKDLRQDISNKSNELIEDTNELLENAKSKANSIIADAKKGAENLLEEGKKKLNGLTDGAQNILNEGKEKAEESVSKVKDAVKTGTDAFNQERNKLNHGNDSEERSKHSQDDKSKYNKSKI